MAIKRVDDRADDDTALLRVTIPKWLFEEVREVKRLCRRQGYAFDIKPDVRRALEEAVAEARKVIGKPGR
jgi:hypothetical protein